VILTSPTLFRYARIMRKFVVSAVVVDVIISAVILFYPSRQVLGAKTTSDTPDLPTYMAEKGESKTHALQSFGRLLTESTPSATPQASPVPSPTPKPLAKSSYTIALLGDSMIDTLGPDLPNLKSILSGQYPGINFKLINYGAGATNIESGLDRLTNATTYLDQVRPPLLSLDPDIVVVESFAYNHWDNTPSDLDRQWQDISKIIETIKNHPPAGGPGTKIVLAAAIAPFCPTYTDGSANLPPERKSLECATVKAYLQNLVNFATSQGYPLADSYHASLSGSEGNPLYINQSDHIHASQEGKALFSQKIAGAIGQVL